MGIYVGLKKSPDDTYLEVKKDAGTAPSGEYATETLSGVIQLATQSEVINGINNNKAVTPQKLKQVLDTKLDKPSTSEEKQDILYYIGVHAPITLAEYEAIEDKGNDLYFVIDD